MKYSFKQILESYTPAKKKDTTLWAKVFSRPISFVLTYILINLGFSANMVSIISMFEALLACSMFIIGGSYLKWGVLLFLIWDVLDCTDGNIARVKKQSSNVGVFFDAVSGYTAASFIYMSIGVAAFYTSKLLGDNNYYFIIIGATSSILDLLGRLIYQKYLVTEYKRDSVLTNTSFEVNLSTGFLRIANLIMKNLSFSSLFMPLLIIAFLSNHFDYLIIFYSLYCLGFFSVAIIYFSNKLINSQEI